MFGRVVLFIVLVPLIELVLLSQVLNKAGLLPTLTIVCLTGFIGVSLARRQGAMAWKAIQRQMSSGQTPSKEILNGVMILFAGAFLITPGIITDVVGFSLLVPQIRMWLGARLSKWFIARTVVSFQSHGVPPMAGNDGFNDERPSVRVVEPK